jgi:cytochrome o ubiquinol oxidase subunit 3
MKNTTHIHDIAEKAATEHLTLGFWLYIMSDCLIFASLFVTYAVLGGETYGGHNIKEITNLPYVLTETLILLSSSFTAGLGTLAIHARRPRRSAAWFAVTLALGLTFLMMELSEFANLVREGHDWTVSAFLSSYFTLVGTHGLHVALGSLWMLILIVMLLTRGYSESMKRRFIALSLFWHFLDVIWIFIFTFVYLLGVAF